MFQSLELADRAASERPRRRLMVLSPEALSQPELIAILQRPGRVCAGSYDESALSSCADHSLVARSRKGVRLLTSAATVGQTVTLAKRATARYFKVVTAPGVRVFGRLGK